MTPPLHVEVIQKKDSFMCKNDLKEVVHSYLAGYDKLTPGVTINNTDLKENAQIFEHVQSITFCDSDHHSDVVTSEADLIYHVYTLDSFGAETDTMTDNSSGEELTVADVWALPAEEFHGLWENLIYDSRLKEDILRFVDTAFELSDGCVDPNIVGCNRVVLLHGPPGTGKTSLCRALAQKLAVRLSERFPRARLLEINAHGLFSKWFSESGKLVAKLFERIREIVEDRRLLACILVDEVESLAHARRAALAGLEPSDSIRAVNAILTQLDRLKRHPNVLVLTTSNVTGAIDVAFVDRADIKRRVGPPSERAAYEILRGCCDELMMRGVVSPHVQLFPLCMLGMVQAAESEGSRASLRLREVASSAAAALVSARALRRLPFLARALHSEASCTPSLPSFIEALNAALLQQLRDETDFCNDAV